jgi:hypothetical protein
MMKDYSQNMARLKALRPVVPGLVLGKSTQVGLQVSLTSGNAMCWYGNIGRALQAILTVSRSRKQLKCKAEENIAL